ncbi:MAG: DUF805 domain-containing protein [Streptococcus sp.]|nr:DUF805 domain-containing protein [Streptococcus sp.]
MFAAYKKYWSHYVDFSGRSSRSDYWWVVLMNVIIVVPISIVFLIFSILTLDASIDYNSGVKNFAALLSVFSTLSVFFILIVIFWLVNLIPSYAITVRRLRDAGYHWAFIFLTLGPAIGSMIPGIDSLAILISFPCNIAMIALLCQKTKLIENNTFVNGQSGFVSQPLQDQQFDQSPQGFGQQPVQGQQFGQSPQSFGQQPVQGQQNTSVQEEQQSPQPTDNSFETKD